MKGTYLITPDNWFTAPDGKQYKAAWGEVVIIDDTFLGIKTNRNSSNWFAKIGTDENHIIIAGCQIHYAIKCSRPANIDVEDYLTANEHGKIDYTRPSHIWIAE